MRNNQMRQRSVWTLPICPLWQTVMEMFTSSPWIPLYCPLNSALGWTMATLRAIIRRSHTTACLWINLRSQMTRKPWLTIRLRTWRNNIFCARSLTQEPPAKFCTVAVCICSFTQTLNISYPKYQARGLMSTYPIQSAIEYPSKISSVPLRNGRSPSQQITWTK